MKSRQNLAIYPGTFDPVTFGHIDVIKRALRVFDRLIVAVADNDGKNPLFEVEERAEMVQKSLKGNRRVSVERFDGLVVNFAKKKRARVLIRGVRMITDFEFEFQMGLTNRTLNPGIETVFLMPHESYAYLTSSLIKEVSQLGADVRRYVPGHVYRRLVERMRLG